MKKRLITLLSLVLLAFAAAVTAQAAPAGSLNNFKVRNTYTCGQFRDVGGAEWYAMYVQADYEYGLFDGKSSDVFAPRDRLTAAEAVKIAASLNSMYHTGNMNFTGGSPWFKPFADFALKKGIIETPYGNYGAYITRSDFAELISKALPSEAFKPINDVSDNAIPDVLITDSFGEAVYKLYRAGVLAGCDSYGTFRPFDCLTRAEAAAIVARASNTEFRKTFRLPSPLDGESIYEKCASSVFYIERFDSEGDLIGIGSGFFITRDGLAVTNYHVIDGVSSAVIMTSDGAQYRVKGVCGYDKTADIAILQIDGSGFDYLSPADSDTLAVGTDVYAIGSPYGLFNTISKGIVSNANQEINGSDYIQFSAPISMGSGGGPILNTSGQVVGVSCLTVTNAQTLNFAVPINRLDGLSRTGCVSLISIISENSDVTAYYKNYYPVPDYGIFVGTALYKSELDVTTGVKTYYYKLSDITVGDEVAVNGYVQLLTQNGFKWQSTYTNVDAFKVDVYYNADMDISVHFGNDIVDGVTCRVVAIY